MSAKSWTPTQYPEDIDHVRFPHRTENEFMTHLLVVNGVKHKGVQKRLRATMRRRLKEQGNKNIGQAWASIPNEWVLESKVNPLEAMKIIK
jgi:hypothetical protein